MNLVTLFSWSFTTFKLRFSCVPSAILYYIRIGSKATQQKHFKRQAQADMEQLMTLVQSTAVSIYMLLLYRKC